MADKPNYNKTRYEQHRVSIGLSDGGMQAVRDLSEEFDLSHGKLFEALAMFTDHAAVKVAVEKYRSHFSETRSKMKADRRRALEALESLSPEALAALLKAQK